MLRHGFIKKNSFVFDKLFYEYYGLYEGLILYEHHTLMSSNLLTLQDQQIIKCLRNRFFCFNFVLFFLFVYPNKVVTQKLYQYTLKFNV